MFGFHVDTEQDLRRMCLIARSCKQVNETQHLVIDVLNEFSLHRESLTLKHGYYIARGK